jgi:type I restriction enzyme, S subunit
MMAHDFGGLPPGWEPIRVRDLADSIQYGHTASAVYSSDGPRFLRITDIQDGQVDWNTVPSCEISKQELDKYRLSPGDLVFARTGATTGKSYLIGDCPEAVFASYLIRVRVSKAVEPRYLAAFFQSPDYWSQIEKGKRGIGQPNVNGKVLGDVVVPIAPRHEQLRIVAEIDKHLTRLDVGVAALRRMQTNMKRYRASVLKAACEGHLVPIEAELPRQDDRPYETGDALLERILTQRRTGWIGRGSYTQPAHPNLSDLPSLPRDWVWATLEQLGTVSGGLTKNPKRTRLPRRMPYLRVANVYANELRLDDIESIGVEESELPRLLLKANDLLIVEGNGSKDQIGRLAIWDGSIDPCVHQNHLIKVRLVDPRLSRWILYWLLSPLGRRLVEVVASSTSGLYTLSISKVSDLPIAVPPLVDQRMAVEEIERRFSVLDELDGGVVANLHRAARLRQSVLRRAFFGKQPSQAQVAESRVEVSESVRPQNELEQDAQGPNMPYVKKTPAGSHKRRDARDVLTSAPRPLTPEELFVQCGRDGSDIDDIDRFFADLRALVHDGFAEETRSKGAITIGVRR